MAVSDSLPVTRRRLLLGGLAAGAALLAACSDGGSDSTDTVAGSDTTGTSGTSAAPDTTASSETTAGSDTTVTTATRPATPACADDDEPTPAQTEGPYFTPNSPERTSLLGDAGEGTKLILSGTVVGTDCQPLGGALLDFWQADDDGQYDNRGHKLRGHQFADGAGNYRLETIVPGLYPGRTRHIHVKVQPRGGKVLTTQLYFPNEPQNARDGIFRSECLLAVSDDADGKAATFTFVLSV